MKHEGRKTPISYTSVETANKLMTKKGSKEKSILGEGRVHQLRVQGAGRKTSLKMAGVSKDAGDMKADVEDAKATLLMTPLTTAPFYTQ